MVISIPLGPLLTAERMFSFSERRVMAQTLILSGLLDLTMTRTANYATKKGIRCQVSMMRAQVIQASSCYSHSIFWVHLYFFPHRHLLLSLSPSYLVPLCVAGYPMTTMACDIP